MREERKETIMKWGVVTKDLIYCFASREEAVRFQTYWKKEANIFGIVMRLVDGVTKEYL